MNDRTTPHKLALLEEETDNTPGTSEGPVIGISANLKEGLSMICNTYVRAILDAGGIPLLIPVIKETEVLRTLIAGLDGLLMSGGGDIDPDFAGEKANPELREFDTFRDSYDFTLVKLAADRQLPILGICRGHQVVNMAFGGTNYQDIYTQHPKKPLQHDPSSRCQKPFHPITIREGSRLYEILEKTQTTVNTIHHQAVNTAAPGFTVTASSEDGIIEAMEAYPEYPILCLQWHPEKMPEENGGEMQKIFRFFINEARLYKQARHFHINHLIIDSHCDTPMKFTADFDLGKRYREVKVSLPKMQEGLIDAVFMVAYIPQQERDDTSTLAATRLAEETLGHIKTQIDLHQEDVYLVNKPEEVSEAKQKGKKAIFTGIENGYAIGKSLKQLEQFKKMGVSYITLCHNGHNDICDSSSTPPEHHGLSEFGKSVVREMNRLGIMVDISHASKESVADVLRESKHPVIASHSSAWALCHHHRNLSDEQIRAIAGKGGVVQVCLYPPFLRDDGTATIRDAIAHINHIVALVGIDHVGIGSDFDGDGQEKLPGCKAANEMLNLTFNLLKEGYTTEELRKLWGGNLMRVMKAVNTQ